MYEDGPDAPTVEPSASPVLGRSFRAVLRIKLRTRPEGAAQPAPRPPEGGPDSHGERGPAPAVPPDPQGFVVLADRLAVDAGCLSLWRTGEVVFCCPVAALASIDFEALGDPCPAPSAEPAQAAAPPAPHGPVPGQPEDPHAEAHRDLASANTRWTAQDEHRLIAMYEAGVSIDVLARTFGRRKGAVRARLFKLRRALAAGPEVPTA